MAKKPSAPIDEELMRKMMSGQIVLHETGTESDPVALPQPLTPDLSTSQSEPRRRRNNPPDFQETFLRLTDIRYRAAIYVDVATKRLVLDVIRKIGDDHMTLTSYVDTILRHHLETYREEINRLHKEQNSKNLI